MCAAAAQCFLFCIDMLLCCLYVIYSFYSQPVYQALLLISIKEAYFVVDTENTKHLLISCCQSAGQIFCPYKCCRCTIRGSDRNKSELCL